MNTQYAVVGQAVPHDSATLHVTGQAHYTDDMPMLPGTLHAAFGLSQRAHAQLTRLDLSAVRSAPGVVAVLTLDDVPGERYLGPVLHDEPIFADGEVLFVGQPLFVVAATSHDLARRAARLAKVEYAERPAHIHTAEAAAAQNYVLPPVQIQRGDTAAIFASAPQRHQGQFAIGGQEHFYLEGQIAYAIPEEQDGMLVHSSTQHPSEMQLLVAKALAQPIHSIKVSCRRMGGGFGGKESQSWSVAVAAALLARHTGRPVKLRADRDDDMMMTGKRHDFQCQFEVAYQDDGQILALKLIYQLRCGYSADLSGPIADRQIFHSDNTYYLDSFDILSLRLRTHTQSNTAFRGFGGPQGIVAIEYVIDDIARRLGLDALDVRFRNFYGGAGRDITPYQMRVEDNVIQALVSQLEHSSDYRQRREAVNAFNAQHKTLQKGLALVPVKFGISFTATHFNQAGALLHIYTDGSVLVNHGGTEMGQGLNTKVAQIVAEELGLPLAQIRVSATDTTKVSNTSATAASTGTDLNGKAAQDAAIKIKAALADYAANTYGCQPQAVRFTQSQVHCGEHVLPFVEFIQQAYRARVPLWSSGFYRTPKIHYDFKTLTGRPFYYFVYGAACAEVLLDTLTGEHRLLRADILYDAGRSINPALDKGQIEGGFIQGMGWLTSEELCWNAAGALTTHAPSTYKIPAVSDCPPEFHIAFFDNGNHEDSIYQSKALGEPPLPLGAAVFFALRDAVAAVGRHQQAPALDAPATPERLLAAITAQRHGLA